MISTKIIPRCTLKLCTSTTPDPACRESILELIDIFHDIGAVEFNIDFIVNLSLIILKCNFIWRKLVSLSLRMQGV